MKTLQRRITFLALLSLLGASSAIAGNTVVLTNKSTYTVDEFYASASSASGWSTSPTDNLLAGKSVTPGQSVTISIPAGSSCSYDLMAVMYGAAQFAYQYQVNVCAGGSWTIS